MQKFGCLIVGIIFIIVGAVLFIKNDYLTKNCTEETIATVVDMHEELDTTSDDVTRYLYYPIIEYFASGKKVEVKMDSASSTPAYRIGEKVTILYNPKKTNEFIIKGDKMSNIFSIGFMGLGVVVTIFGIVLLVKKEQ
ncbi:MAG: DUF3592 domain-containing protein [Bacilli bacterium]|nr:DUF3592 domain-containing protein [Bacilli bacterium]